jgi:hypothetical protein
VRPARAAHLLELFPDSADFRELVDTELERVGLTRGEQFLVEGWKLDPKRPCLVR